MEMANNKIIYEAINNMSDALCTPFIAIQRTMYSIKGSITMKRYLKFIVKIICIKYTTLYNVLSFHIFLVKRF